MTWYPKEDIVRMIDISKYNNPYYSSKLKYQRESGRINFVELGERNPNIKVVIARLAGAWGKVDQDFEYNYDKGGDAGFDMGLYLNTNPYYAAYQMMEDWWMPGIGDREPKLIVIDVETNGWYDKKKQKTVGKKSKATTTTHVKNTIELVSEQWPKAKLWIYSGDFWQVELIHGWESHLKFWVPHYPTLISYIDHKNRKKWRQFQTFAEADERLPFDGKLSGFPRTVGGVTEEQKIAWQFSDKGLLDPITKPGKLMPNCDMNYLLKSEYERVWGEELPEPTPDPEIDPEPALKVKVDFKIMDNKVQLKSSIPVELIND